MKRPVQCAEHQDWPDPRPSLSTALATKSFLQDLSEKSLNCFRQKKNDSTTIRPWSEDKIVISHPPLRDLTCPISETHFVAATKSDTPTSPNIASAMKNASHNWSVIDLRRIWNVQYNARSIKIHPPTPPNIADATKNDSLLFPTRLFYTIPYSTLLFSTILYSTRLFCTILHSTLLFSAILYSALLILFSTIQHYSTLLYYSLLYSTLLYSTILSHFQNSMTRKFLI